MNITVFGLGKLGSPMVAVFASAGHYVTGVDLNPAFVDALNHAKAPVDEPQLQDLLVVHAHQITATQDGYKACRDADKVFVVVPTPSQNDGLFANDYVLQCMEPIGLAIKKHGCPKQVVVVSTVVPRHPLSSMEAEIQPALEASGAKGCDYDLLYNPEFIALGSVVHDMLAPDYILIGGEDEANERLAEFWRTIVPSATFRMMNWINAELTKIIQNCFVTTKLSAANMIGNLCERFPGADADVVLAAVGTDSRIGSKYLRAATAFGGPCFPRDNRALMAVAKTAGVTLPLAEATQSINRAQTGNLVQTVLGHLESLPERTVGVLGLSYKTETSVCEESAGLHLTNALSDAGVDVFVFDPFGMPEASHGVSSAVRLCDSLESCVRQSAVLVVMVPWLEFRNIRLEWLEREGYRPAIIDCWRFLEEERLSKQADYIVLGKGEVR